MKNTALKIDVKRKNLLEELVSEFGEGAIIRFKEVEEFYNKKQKEGTKASKKFPCPATFQRDPMTKVARGKFLVSKNPTEAKLKRARKKIGV